jgi:hypothetical protein
MEELKNIIHKVLSNKSSEIDWLVVHTIHKSAPKITIVEFSFIDGKERQDEPFKTNQGYISLKKAVTIEKFKEIIGELSIEFKANPISLANLFIITTRASYAGEDDGTLLSVFKDNIGKENCNIVFNLLINSLNTEYHNDKRYVDKQPENTNEWLTLFHSTQYLHEFSDPITNCLQLVRDERSRSLEFDLIQNMKPLLRAVLMGWYGYDLTISQATQDKIYENEQELTFLSACLIDDFSGEKVLPDWLNSKLVELFVEKYWAKIGKPVFIHVFGISYRNKQENNLYKKLEELLHEILFKKLTNENAEAIKWISLLEFSTDFIALFSWFVKKEVKYNEIPTSIISELLKQFIKELQRISAELPRHLASENSSDPFNSFQFSEPKYQDAFAHLSLLLLYGTKENFKDIKSVCFSIKPLFYGGFRATYLAIHFTELLLLIGLSGFRLNGLDEDGKKVIKNYLKIISDLLLVPYIHLSERNDEIWNPESKKELLQYNAGQYLVNYAITEINNLEDKRHYDNFIDEINDIKVSKKINT